VPALETGSSTKEHRWATALLLHFIALILFQTSLASPFKVNDSFGFGQEHVACARRALKGPGYAYKAG
jgi:hypothetical protein